MVRRIYAAPRSLVGNLMTYHTRGDVRTSSILISIFTAPDQQLITLDKHRDMLRSYGFIDFLELSFVDVVPEEFPRYLSERQDTAGHHLFSLELAQRIMRFVDGHKYEDIDRLLVHCDFGKSRSGAVAAWAYQYLSRQGLVEWPADKFWASNKEISPNPFVARLLCEASGMEFREKDF